MPAASAMIQPGYLYSHSSLVLGPAPRQIELDESGTNLCRNSVSRCPLLLLEHQHRIDTDRCQTSCSQMGQHQQPQLDPFEAHRSPAGTFANLTAFDHHRLHAREGKAANCQRPTLHVLLRAT